MRKRPSTSKPLGTQPAAMHEPNADVSSEGRLSRRHFLTSSAASVVAGAIASETLAGTALSANHKAKSSGPSDSRGGRTLLKGGCVLSLDASVGDFDTADVLIEGSKTVAVQPNLKASAAVIDASNMIVMPGFVDTHCILHDPLPFHTTNGMFNPDAAGREATMRRLLRRGEFIPTGFLVVTHFRCPCKSMDLASH
jgi:hypothetical protein